MESGITLGIHVKNNVLPKLRTKKEKRDYMAMGVIVDSFGVDGFAMAPSDFVELQNSGLEKLKQEYEEYDKRTPRAKKIKKEIEECEEYNFTQQDWLNFLSYPIVAKFLENQILKLNAVIYRQKLTVLAQKADISQADIRYISILKDIIDESRNGMENDIIHISTFYPPRYNIESVKEDKTFDKEKERKMKEIIDYLEIDTDYMDKIDIKIYKDKKAHEAKAVEEAKEIAKDHNAIEKQAKTKEDEAMDEVVDDIFGGE